MTTVLWTKPSVDGDIPEPRGGHTAIVAESQIVVFGGHSYSGNGKFEYYNDTHVLDTETLTWHLVQCSGDVPAPRYGHSVELVGSRMFLFGGKGEGAIFRDLYFLDLVEWTWVPVHATSVVPSPRFYHGSLLVGRKIVVHGGWDGGAKSLGDLWVFDTDSFGWLQPRTGGLPPGPRHGHSLSLLPDGRILCFGGMTVEGSQTPKYQGDLRQLDPETMVWSKPRTAGAGGAPSGRYSQTMSLMEGSGAILVIGGWGLGGLQDGGNKRRGSCEASVLRVAANAAGDAIPIVDDEGAHVVGAAQQHPMAWAEPIYARKPIGIKYGHTASVVREKLFVFGGWNGKQATAELVEVTIGAEFDDGGPHHDVGMN